MTVSTRRERRQQQRRQEQRRAKRGSGPGPRRLSQAWVAVAVVVFAAVVIFGARAAGVFDPPARSGTDVAAVDVSGGSGDKIEDRGNAHVPSGQRVTYPSLPPTSGEHWPQPAAPAPWGVKTSMLPFEVTVHNLEHGGIVIMYAPDLTTAQVDDLRAIVRQLNAAGYPKILLEPWPDMPKDSKVILTAWDWILKLPNIDATQIIKFTKIHHNGSDAPEPNVP